MTTIQGDFQHDFQFLRAVKKDGTSHNGFRWSLELGSVVVPPDWDPKPECGNGLHGLADGLGDYGLLPAPSDPDVLWLVCGGLRTEAVDLDGKVKVPRAKLLYVGSFAGAMERISPDLSAAILRLIAKRTKAARAEGVESTRKNGGAASATGWRGAASATGESGAASATGWSGAASATGLRGAASATGEGGAASATGLSGAASATGKHCVALAAGREARGMVAKGCLLVLVERDPKTGEILHHFAAMCGKRGVKPDTWYTLRGGELVGVKP